MPGIDDRRPETSMEFVDRPDGVTVFEARTEMPVSARRLHAWHARDGAFERLQPPWENVRVVARDGGIRDGALVRVRTPIGPFSSEWLIRHEGYEEGSGFCDVMVKGPFARWRHEHRFRPLSETTSLLCDRIEYKLPLGACGRVFGGSFVRQKLKKLFSFRHATTQHDLGIFNEQSDLRRMKILISGASGLVGSALAPFLTTQGHEVVRLGRSARDGCVQWDPAAGTIDESALAGVDAVVHLAGANVGSGRWTASRKKEILESRVVPTRFLVDVCGRMPKPPSVFVSASASGFYGNTGEREIDEDEPAGTGFLADVCRQWEAEAMRAADFGMRAICLRTGVVLTPKGGALAKLLPVFRVGLGGPAGNGRQWMSWIAIDDLLAVILHVVSNSAWTGPVNVVSPNPVQNAEFSTVLGKVLGRPSAVAVPSLALKAMFGQMARETILASACLRPRRLIDSGFQFQFETIEPALRHLLG
jgi:uncharacterized protein (TIGR01777 family)